MQGAGNDLSHWCLIAAIAAIGMKTHLKELATVGFKPVALMLGETTFLALLALALLRSALQSASSICTRLLRAPPKWARWFGVSCALLRRPGISSYGSGFS